MNSVDGWTLEEAVSGDVDRLMKWFPDAQSIDLWGGPDFRFPFTRHSFAEDMHWGRIASFSLRNPAGELAAFGQLYEKYNCIRLARLVANPSVRGQKVGKRLVAMLMRAGRPMFACSKFSLVVHRDNTPAYECYKAMGFTRADFPDGEKMGDVCDYLTRPVDKCWRSDMHKSRFCRNNH